MIRTIISYFMLGFSLVISLFIYLVCFIVGLFSKKVQDNMLHKSIVIWARFMVALSGSTINVVNEDKLPDGNVLYVGNHQGYFDIPLSLGYLPKHKAFVAKIEMIKAPILSLWMKKMGCIFLDRSNLRQSVKVIKEGIEKLKSGASLVIFPEGTRAKSNQVAEFKKGSMKLGVKANVPIVPFTIDGSFKMYEGPGKRITKSTVNLIIHDPIYPDQLTKEQLFSLSEDVREIIIAPIAQYQNAE